MTRSLGALALIAGTLSACGSSSTPVILNTERVERAIEASITAQRGLRAHVTCPSGVHQKKGLVFNCTATTVRGVNNVRVTETDGAGHVSYVVQ